LAIVSCVRVVLIAVRIRNVNQEEKICWVWKGLKHFENTKTSWTIRQIFSLYLPKHFATGITTHREKIWKKKITSSKTTRKYQMDCYLLENMNRNLSILGGNNHGTVKRTSVNFWNEVTIKS
jgi:hypothetical protein